MSKAKWTKADPREWAKEPQPGKSSNVLLSSEQIDKVARKVAQQFGTSKSGEARYNLIESVKSCATTVDKTKEFQTTQTGFKHILNVSGIEQVSEKERHKETGGTYMPKAKKTKLATKKRARAREQQPAKSKNIKMSSKEIDKVAQKVVQQLYASTSEEEDYDSFESDSESEDESISSSLTLEKTRKFQTTSMRKKRISKVGGIGQLSSEKLNDAGIKYAEQLFGKFLMIGPDNEAKFKEWLERKTELKACFQDECYQSLYGWYQNFFK